MSNPNVAGSDQATLQGVIDPQVAAPGTLDTPFVSLALAQSLLATVLVGAAGSPPGTVTVALRQAINANGDEAKPITGKVLTAIGAGKQGAVNVRGEELDVTGGFTHVSARVTVADADAPVCAAVHVFDARYQPATPVASLEQVVA